MKAKQFYILGLQMSNTSHHQKTYKIAKYIWTLLLITYKMPDMPLDSSGLHVGACM